MKKLLVIGAGFLQAFVIKKAKAMGYNVIAVDGNPQALGFKYADRYAVVDIVDQKACLDYAKEEQIDGVLTAATDYGVLTSSYIAKELNLPGLNYSVAKLIKNKYDTKRRLLDNNVDDTKQAYEVDKDTDLERLKTVLQYPVMVKPCDGSGSRGAARVDDATALKRACDAAINASVTKKAVIETFIFGKEYGAESIVINGKVYVLAIIKKWMTEAPYYAELGHAIPCDLSEDTERKARQCVENAIKALGVNFGSVNMDMIITEDGNVHIIDVGARMGGNLIGSHIIPCGTGIDYMAAVIQSAVGDTVDMCSGDKKSVVTRLLAFNAGTVSTVPDIRRLQEQYNVIVEHHIQIGDEVHEYHTNLDGCGYIVSVNESANTAEEMAERALAEIRNTIFN